jgi:hypothetical protein
MTMAGARSGAPFAYRFIVRAFLIVLAAVAIVWAVNVFPSASQEARLDRIADRIVTGEKYALDVLLEFSPLLDDIEQEDVCRPVSLSSAAIIRLRIAEETIEARDRKNIDPRLDRLTRSIRRSLECSPADSFLWMILFWAESTKNGFDPKYFDYLRLSHRLGPNEGWIAVKRNFLAFSLFDQLPADLAELTLVEFSRLLASGFEREAVAIFIGPAWPRRDKLLSRLGSLTDQQRSDFARTLYRLGYDVDVPGVVQPEARPWH